jgi:hypothetical protein
MPGFLSQWVDHVPADQCCTLQLPRQFGAGERIVFASNPKKNGTQTAAGLY